MLSGVGGHSLVAVRDCSVLEHMPVKLIYKMQVCELLSRVRFFVTPWTVAHPDPLSMEFSRHEFWSG